MKSLVSIIIPNYNYGRYLDDCIKSCLSQSHGSIEIIVVDDCSTDNSKDIILGYGNRIKYILNGQNRGVSYCRNAGIDLCSGEYISFCDSDDMFFEDAVELRIACFKKHPEAGMVHGYAKKINAERKNYDWSFDECVKNKHSLETYSRPIHSGTLMWKREVFEKYGCFYEGLKSKEDKEMLYRLGIHPKSTLKKRITAVKCKDFIMVYRRHPGSKHKKRVMNTAWAEETERIFLDRIKELKEIGITNSNTRFPSWTQKKN